MGFVRQCWRFIFGIVRKYIGGTCLRSQKPSGALVESNKATTAKTQKVNAIRGPAQLADLQGALCVPTNNITIRHESAHQRVSLSFRSKQAFVSDRQMIDRFNWSRASEQKAKLHLLFIVARVNSKCFYPKTRGCSHEKEP